MKKIFTLSLTLFLLSTAAFSQHISGAVTFNVPMPIKAQVAHYVEAYSFTKYDRDKKITAINAAYNQQVREAMLLRIPASKKIDLIQQLQKERNNKIFAINNRFNDHRNKYYYDGYNHDVAWRR